MSMRTELMFSFTGMAIQRVVDFTFASKMNQENSFCSSLRTSNRNEALFKAEQFYRENKNAISRGVKVNGINTKELIRQYLNERRQLITDILIRESQSVVSSLWRSI